MTSTETYPLHVRLILRKPERVMANVRRALETGLVKEAPNAWQVCQGVLRMYHRMFFRSETVGHAPSVPVRNNLRAKLMAYRPLRFPFLVKERVIAPFDLSGMLSSPRRIRRHMMGAYHAGDEFHYDLQLLSLRPGAIEILRDEVNALIEHDTPRHLFLRDLNAYEGYHEALASAVDRALSEGVHDAELDANPDWSLVGYLNWCSRQPKTRSETLALYRTGKFRFEDGLRAEVNDA